MIDVEILYKNPDFSAELCEHVEPLKYIDKYAPYKYGILFKERIFVADKCLASFYVKIANV